jgi:hypothetical protein
MEINKPDYATSEEWTAWDHQFETRHPILYPIVEDWLDKFQDVVMFPYDVFDSVRIYFRNRFATRTHLMDTKLAPGEWHETDERMLHGMFEALVDFVEVEKANMWINCQPDDVVINKRSRWLRWSENRSPEYGVEYLQWEINLVNDGQHDINMCNRQSVNAQEQLDLYNWWKVIRPARPDPYEVTGWNELNDKLPLNSTTAYDREVSQQIREASIKVGELEEQWHDEDNKMLIRLINIRRSLWT